MPNCYSRWSFGVALILLRRKQKIEIINIKTMKQAMPAEIPAALLFLPVAAYAKHEFKIGKTLN